jgi:hypothetical protein
MQSAASSIARGADSLLLLRGAERRAAALPEDRRARARELCRTADGLRLAASQLAQDGRPVAAAVLFREAAALLVGAISVVASAGGGEWEPPPAAEAFERYDRLVVAGDAPALPPAQAGARALLEQADVLGLERAFENAPVDALAGPADLVAFLRAQVEIRTPPAIRAQRRARIGALVILAVLGLVVLVRHIRAPGNLARGKPVTASSVRASSGPPSSVVNGSVESNVYAFATNDDPDPWLTVDLLQPHPLRSVLVYNRGDGGFDKMLPFSLEISADGHVWRSVGRQTTPFSQSEPATFSLAGDVARYVRVHGTPGHAVCLNEIEVR